MGMDDVPVELFNEIGKYLDMQSCVAFSQCCKKNQILNEITKSNLQKWQMWYKSQVPKTKVIKNIDWYRAHNDIINISCIPFDEIQKQIIYFVFSREVYLQLAVNEVHAQWITIICTCLKIDSVNNKGKIELKKKSNWVFNPNKTMTYESLSRKVRRKKWQEMQKERNSRLKAWSANCIFCTKKLSAYTAFFNRDVPNSKGIGPICIPCIQDDDDLEMTEWQNYARLH